MKKIIAVSPQDVENLGIQAAYYFAQLKFYEKLDGIGRPFERTPSEIKDDICMTSSQQEYARKKLVDWGFIDYETTKRGYRWVCKFRILAHE